jgi:hypothetical protein
MASVEETDDIEEEDDIFNKDKSINDEVDDEVSKLLGDNKMYGKDDTSKMSTLPGEADEAGDAAARTTGKRAAPQKSAADSARDMTTDLVSAVMSGMVPQPQSGIALALARREALNKKLGIKSSGNRAPLVAPTVAAVEEEGCFETTIEINDFPSEARFKVTRKEFVDEIAERSETAITTRGSFYPPNHKMKEGEKKLCDHPSTPCGCTLHSHTEGSFTVRTLTTLRVHVGSWLLKAQLKIPSTRPRWKSPAFSKKKSTRRRPRTTREAAGVGDTTSSASLAVARVRVVAIWHSWGARSKNFSRHRRSRPGRLSAPVHWCRLKL